MKSSKSHYDISLQQVSLHYDISMDGWDGMGWDGMDVCIYSAIIKTFKTQIKIMGVLETTHYLLIKKIVHYCSFSRFFFQTLHERSCSFSCFMFLLELNLFHIFRSRNDIFCTPLFVLQSSISNAMYNLVL